jgi:2-methylisocitrate lyase-like PEP mutase family enzyme
LPKGGFGRDLVSLADDLRARHFAPGPLVLANVWDSASARAVATAGHPVVATSSAAVAASLGLADHEQMSADDALTAVARIADAVDLPVTADLEAGYGLSPSELVDRLLDAGAVGCNLEDSDHHGSASLVEADRQVDYIAAVCDAARRLGVDLVVNARVDVFVRQSVPTGKRVEESLRRGRRYLEAGATCVYPIGVTDEADIAALVGRMGGPVNILLRSDTPSLDVLRRTGVARVSVAAGLQRMTMARTAELAAALLSGDDATIRGGS